jgi:DNA modification methylase
MVKKIDNLKREQKINEEIINKEKYQKIISSHVFKHLINNKDSSNMKEIKDNSVDLIITSPPYFNSKEYVNYKNIEEYYEKISEVVKECYRVLKPGRKFCLNISDIPQKSDSGIKWLTLGAGLINLFEKENFQLADRIFWFKTPLKGFQYGSLPFPPSPLINDSIEYIYIFRKPNNKKPDYSYVKQDYKFASKLTRDEYGEFTKQIWTIRRVRLKDNQDGHIAPFPEEIPHRLIKLYSFVGDTILDPFSGSGTTSLMALKNRRNSIGYEINEFYAKMSYKRLVNNKDLFNNDVIELKSIE